MANQIIDGSFKSFIFAGGEVHVKITNLPSLNVKIKSDLKSSNDIMELLMLCDALRRHERGVESIELIIPYFPYARQDRVCDYGEALSVSVMASLINSIRADKVIIYDPHSDVTPALLNNCEVVPLHEVAYPILSGILEDHLLVCPDAGAEKKIRKFQKPYIMAGKTRDVKTGAITNTWIQADTLDPNAKYLIVDDICDGGWTFTELAKAMRLLGAKHVDLWVTHGLFSKGFDVFKDHINNIYYYDMGSIKTQHIF